ncbi:MAG: hypothetical protein ABIY50_11875 [Ignavibacteria bacterium]
MSKKVLLAFDDPGGGLAVSSLIESLEEKGFQLNIYAGKLSRGFVKNLHSQYLESNIISNEANEILLACSPDLLITGTSAGNAEQELRNSAYKKNIKSVVILDFWKDYSRRWLYADYKVEHLKDTVCVMDYLTKKEMLEEKFPENKLEITGQPYLDRLFNFENHNFNADQKAGNLNILFLSQPLNIIGIKDYKIHPFKILLDALKEYTYGSDKKISLIVKLHPTEELTSELDNLINEYGSDLMQIEYAGKDAQLKELINYSQIVFGYNTIAMFESIAMNKRTVSLKVVPVKESLEQAMITAGIEIIDSNIKNILNCLLKNSFTGVPKKIFQNGIRNCLNVISKELTIN